MSGYKLTPSRRQSILKAQRRSAIKRKRKAGFIGKMMAQGAKQTVNAASLGTSNKLYSYFAEDSQRNIRRNAKLRRKAALKAQRGY